MNRLFYTLTLITLWALAPAGYATGIELGSAYGYAPQEAQIAQLQTTSDPTGAPSAHAAPTHSSSFSQFKPAHSSSSLAERVEIEDDAPTEDILVSALGTPYGDFGLLDEKLGSGNDANGPPVRLFLSQCKLRL